MSVTQWPQVEHDSDTITPDRDRDLWQGDGEDLPPAGSVIGAYRLEEVVGCGGMGYVWRATHIKLGRPVALKMLRRRYAQDANAVRRFFGEARAVNHIRHDNIIDVTDFIEGDGISAYVMELLEGQSLANLVEQGPLPAARVLDIGGQIANAMAAVHAAGVVHRDLKPDNVFLTASNGRRDVVKLLDFGVARLGASLGGVRTNAGEIFGTPAYMAPEQFGGRDIDHRVDIYAFGVILHELLTGVRPFAQNSLGDLAVAHLTTAPPPLGDDIPAGLRALVAACLEKNAEARPADMNLVLTALREPDALLVPPLLATPTPVPVRRRGRTAALVGLAVALTAVIAAGVVGAVDAAASEPPPALATGPTRPVIAAPVLTPTVIAAPVMAPAVIAAAPTVTAAPRVARKPRPTSTTPSTSTRSTRRARSETGSERSTILSPFGD